MAEVARPYEWNDRKVTIKLFLKVLDKGSSGKSALVFYSAPVKNGLSLLA